MDIIAGILGFIFFMSLIIIIPMFFQDYLIRILVTGEE